MKSVLIALVLGLIVTATFAQETNVLTEQVFVSKQKSFSFTSPGPLEGHFLLTLNESDLPRNQDRWYVFAMAQPDPKNAELFGDVSKIQISKLNNQNKQDKKLIKQCKIVEDTDSCFIRNNQFDYKTEKLVISVHCLNQCQFNFVTQVDSAYPLAMNKPFKLNFQNTAYSKIFNLDTSGVDFYELRIKLEPFGFIKFGEPIVLFANYGKEVPTRQKHDFMGIHSWNDGQIIYIRKSQMKQRFLTLLVEGPQENILNLEAMGWQKEEKIKLMEYWPEFDALRATEFRDFFATIPENQTYRFKIAVFSGAIEEVKVFKLQSDSIRPTPLNFAMPAQKYGQFQFRLSKQLVQKQSLKNVLVQVRAKKDLTYLLSYSRQTSQISVILPYISQSSIMEPKQVDQYYIKVEQIIQPNKDRKSSNIQVIVGNIDGDINVSFYRCMVPYKLGVSNEKSCQRTSSNLQDFVPATPAKKQNRGSERRYWFEVDWSDLIKKTDTPSTQIVYQMVAVVENNDLNKMSTYEIQYKNKDRIYLLREGELIKDRVFINEKRHYKLSITGDDATEVRIHCTRISGEAFFIGSPVDPRVNKQHQKILPLYGVITFKLPSDKPTKQIFVEVEGVDNAYYSLTTQVLRKSQSNSTKKNTTGYNELIVREQTSYEFHLIPQDSIVLQLHATSRAVYMNLKASLAVQVCMTENLSSPPFAPNCEIKNESFIEFNDKIFFERGLVGNIGIRNRQDKNVTIKIMVNKVQKEEKGEESKQPKPDTNCEIAAMNELMFKRIDSRGRDQDGESTHCIQFNLNRDADVELIVDFNSDFQYDKGTITASINDQQLIRILSPSHIFTKEEVASACGKRSVSQSSSFCYLKVKISEVTDTRVRVLAQYNDEAIRLIDGLAHSVTGQMSKSAPRHFYYKIRNIENVVVFLENKLGTYKVYGQVIKYDTFLQKTAESRKNGSLDFYPTPKSKDIESSNPFYYLEQTVIVSADLIKSRCQSMRNGYGLDCLLLLSVHIQDSSEVLNNGKFVIQATQQNREIREGVPLNGFLQKKSIAFYHFQNDVENGTLVITASNQNKNCLNIYARQGAERATDSNNDKKARASNSLLFSKTVKGTYSITVEAVDNCPYTLTVSSTKNFINRIKKGAFVDVKLGINEQTNLLYQNLVNQTFKILSTHKSGEVIISVNPVPRNQLQQVLKSDLQSIRNWQWSNKDSVKISSFNSRRNTTNPAYCFDCYYLININAQRPTEASIIIPTPGSELPLTADSLIKDLLAKNQQSIYRAFTESKSQFEVYVQYGKVKITIMESGEDKIAFNQTFEPTKAPVVNTFALSKSGEDYDFLRYSKIKIEALEESYFSFAILSNADPNKRGPQLKYGMPEYVFLESGKQKCIAGSLVMNGDEFLLSFSKTSKPTLSNVQIVIKVDGKQVKYDKQLGSNEMILKLINTNTDSQNKPFELCLESKEAVSITVIQSSPVNYWPEKQSLLFTKQMNLTFGSEGKNLIEVNECKSRANTEIFSQFNNLKSTSSQIKQRRRNNNIIQFYYYGAVFVSVRADKASVRWFAVDESKGTGLGYDEFKASWVRVFKQPNSIEVIAQPIQSVGSGSSASKSKIQSVTYSFYAAKEEMQMYGAMNCRQGEFLVQSKTVDYLSSTQATQKQSVRIEFNIQKDLLAMFSRYSYFLVGMKAEMTLKAANGDIETYRFYYPYQQVGKEMLQITSFNEKPIDEPREESQSSGLATYAGYALLLILGGAVVYFVYSKFIKKCFSKRMPLHEEGMEMKYSDFTV